MKSNSIVIRLALIIIPLALLAAGAGVFWQGTGEPYSFDTLRGETVMIRGHGLYRYDTVNSSSQEVGADIVTLLIGIPLLITGIVLSRKGTLRGQLLLTGALGYFLLYLRLNVLPYSIQSALPRLCCAVLAKSLRLYSLHEKSGCGRSRATYSGWIPSSCHCGILHHHCGLSQPSLARISCLSLADVVPTQRTRIRDHHGHSSHGLGHHRSNGFHHCFIANQETGMGLRALFCDVAQNLDDGCSANLDDHRSIPCRG